MDMESTEEVDEDGSHLAATSAEGKNKSWGRERQERATEGTSARENGKVRVEGTAARESGRVGSGGVGSGGEVGSGQGESSGSADSKVRGEGRGMFSSSDGRGGGERLQSPFRVISSIHYFLWRYHAVYGRSKVSTAICHRQSPSLDI